MAETADYEHLITSIASLASAEVRQKIRDFHGSFKLDFSDDYLEALKLDQLRHILFAAMLTKYKRRAADN
ncbi:MAG: hypothetical protein K8R02_01275 [Anaerohalosphaeraceae bacterium]|nr:hypothetical protein [Anaerohalosphaeraceae bacterium]